MDTHIPTGMLVAFYIGNGTVKKGVYKSQLEVAEEVKNLEAFYQTQVRHKVLRKI